MLQFISGVFFVFNDLPTWMQQVASVFPLKWMAQGMRSVFLPPSAESWEVSGSWQHGATAAVLLVWAVAAPGRRGPHVPVAAARRRLSTALAPDAA